MTLQELHDIIAIEKKRKALAKKHDLSAFRRTYRPVVKKNGNTGRFWDHRFDAEGDETQVNYSERDRNITAYHWLLELLHPGTRVLNVGCGNGKFESFFNLEKFAGVAYEGIDFARHSIQALSATYPQFDFRVGDILTEKLLRLYDIVCIFEVLEHISPEHVLNVLRALHRATDKHGYLLVAVPVNEPLLEMFPSNPNEHVRLYSREVICAELEIAGFEIVRVEEFIAFSSQYTLKKLLSRTILKNHWKPNDLLIMAKKA